MRIVGAIVGGRDEGEAKRNLSLCEKNMLKKERK